MQAKVFYSAVAGGIADGVQSGACDHGPWMPDQTKDNCAPIEDPVSLAGIVLKLSCYPSVGWGCSHSRRNERSPKGRVTGGEEWPIGIERICCLSADSARQEARYEAKNQNSAFQLLEPSNGEHKFSLCSKLTFPGETRSLPVLPTTVDSGSLLPRRSRKPAHLSRLAHGRRLSTSSTTCSSVARWMSLAECPTVSCSSSRTSIRSTQHSTRSLMRPRISEPTSATRIPATSQSMGSSVESSPILVRRISTSSCIRWPMAPR